MSSPRFHVSLSPVSSLTAFEYKKKSLSFFYSFASVGVIQKKRNKPNKDFINVNIHFFKRRKVFPSFLTPNMRVCSISSDTLKCRKKN